MFRLHRLYAVQVAHVAGGGFLGPPLAAHKAQIKTCDNKGGGIQ